MVRSIVYRFISSHHKKVHKSHRSKVHHHIINQSYFTAAIHKSMSTTTIPMHTTLPKLPPLPIDTDDIRNTHGFTNTAHWVIPNILMQGSRPGFGVSSETTLQDQVQTIKEAGCTTFVCAQAECLPEEGSILLDNDGGVRKSQPKDLSPYASHVISAAKGDDSTSNKPTFLYYGIIGMQTAKSNDSLSNAVHDIANRIKDNETVYIHCGGGVGRAGLLTACVLGLLYDDLDAESALEYTTAFCQVRNMKGIEEEVHYSSPETDEQKDQVREFYKKIRG